MFKKPLVLLSFVLVSQLAISTSANAAVLFSTGDLSTPSSQVPSLHVPAEIVTPTSSSNLTRIFLAPAAGGLGSDWCDDISQSLVFHNPVSFSNIAQYAPYHVHPSNGLCALDLYTSSGDLTGGSVGSGQGYILTLGANTGDWTSLFFQGSSGGSGAGHINGAVAYTNGGVSVGDFYVVGSDSGSYVPPAGNGNPFYAQIKNTAGGYMRLRDAANTSANIIKTLPEDWIVHVSSTTDSGGANVTANGFHWYEVTDPTDNVSGWMAGEDASSTIQYLPYSFDATQQSVFQASSTDYVATSSRPTIISNAIDHYYNDTSTTTSLYSSDDGPSGYEISQLKDGNYPKELILGIAAHEDGGIYSLNNENVSSDYGHGVMQITFDPGYPFDNRGIASNVTIPPCALGSSLYTNCYTSAGGAPLFLRHYKPYGGSPPTYKQYSNTEQSIYANIKDGMFLLSHNYDVFSYINNSTTTGGVTYSADERKDILTTLFYNGGYGNCTSYIGAIADTLDNLTDDFPTATTSGITTLISKMHSAATNVSCADLNSPGELSIQSADGKTVGVVNGKEENSFPLALYDRTKKYAAILSANDSGTYTYKVEGTGKGTYGLDIAVKTGDQETVFRASDIAMLPGEVHEYVMDKDALQKGQDGVTLKIDRNGDGIVDRTLKSGTRLTGHTYNMGATPEELQAFKIGDVSPPAPEKKVLITPEGKPSTGPFNFRLREPEKYPSLLREYLLNQTNKI